MDEQEDEGHARALPEQAPSPVPGHARSFRRGARDARRDERESLRIAAGELRSERRWADEVIVELLAGDPAAAAEVGAEGCRLLDEQGEKSLLSTAAGRLAQALYALDRLDEADAWAVRAGELGASEDAMTQMLSLQVRGKVLARRGDFQEAESHAREAVAIGEKTDMINMQGDAYLDLGEVLVLTGRSDEAVAALEQAVERYERKGNLASTQHAQARLAEIGAVGRRAH